MAPAFVLLWLLAQLPGVAAPPPDKHAEKRGKSCCLNRLLVRSPPDIYGSRSNRIGSSKVAVIID
jgi:hypothetical protein